LFEQFRFFGRSELHPVHHRIPAGLSRRPEQSWNRDDGKRVSAGDGWVHFDAIKRVDGL
jgi:hypothetical protein